MLRIVDAPYCVNNRLTIPSSNLMRTHISEANTSRLHCHCYDPATGIKHPVKWPHRPRPHTNRAHSTSTPVQGQDLTSISDGIFPKLFLLDSHIIIKPMGAPFHLFEMNPFLLIPKLFHQKSLGRPRFLNLALNILNPIVSTEDCHLVAHSTPLLSFLDA